MENIPEEIMIHIFGFLHFETLQKVATLVCKHWFKIIRLNCKLSGHLKIKRGLNSSDISTILENWSEIRELEIPKVLSTYHHIKVCTYNE